MSMHRVIFLSCLLAILLTYLLDEFVVFVYHQELFEIAVDDYVGPIQHLQVNGSQSQSLNTHIIIIIIFIQQHILLSRNGALKSV